MPYGISYLSLLEETANETGIFSTFVSIDFQEMKEELALNHPVISRRLLRDVVFDYVVITGFDKGKDTLIGLTTYSKHPFEITKEMWEKDFYYFGDNWSIVTSSNKNYIDQLQVTSKPYWLQLAVKSIAEQNYALLEQAIYKIEEYDIHTDRVMFIKAFYYLIIKIHHHIL